VKRTVINADPSGQFALDLGKSNCTPIRPRTSASGKAKFIEHDPEPMQIGLKEHLQKCGSNQSFVIDEVLRAQDWSVFEVAYKAGGRPAYAPRVMVGLILFGVMNGKSSLRELEKLARDSLECLWLTGGIMPDHSIIGRFINQHADLLSGEFFKAVTRTVLKQTRSNTERTAGDGTIVEAAASRYKTIKREALEKQITRAEQRLDHERDNAKADEKEIEKAQKRLDRLKDAEQKLGEREAKRQAKGKDPSRVQINPGEADAVNQPLKRQGYGVSYKPSIIVNDQRVIVGHGVHASSETLVGVDLIHQASQLGHLHESSWDAGYNNEQMLEQQARYEVSLLIPEGRKYAVHWSESSKPYYGKNQFIYDASTDSYRCPADQLLRPTSHYKGNENNAAHIGYTTKACQSCEQRDRCTKSKRGRRINRYPSDPLREAMREKLEDNSVSERYRQRAGWVEPVFGHLQLQQGLTRFRRKGLDSVKVEFALHVLAYNLRRVVAYFCVHSTWLIAPRRLMGGFCSPYRLISDLLRLKNQSSVDGYIPCHING